MPFVSLTHRLLVLSYQVTLANASAKDVCLECPPETLPVFDVRVPVLVLNSLNVFEAEVL